MLDARFLTEKANRVLAQEGIAPMCDRALTHPLASRQQGAFNLEHEAETSGFEPPCKLSSVSCNTRYGKSHEATMPHDLPAVWEVLNISLKNFSSIDMRWRKGRLLILEGRLGFCRVDDVDFDQELTATAEANLASLALHNAVELRADAARFDFPLEAR